MLSTDAIWASVYGTSGIALSLGADTRLSQQQAAECIAIQSTATTASMTTHSEDNRVAYCLSQAMTLANKGRG